MTVTSSAAGLIILKRANAAAPISFREYFQVGLPITVATLIFGSAWVWLIA